MIRYTYATARSWERINEILEDCFANGEVSWGEDPQCKPVRDHNKRITHYELTLKG